MRVVGDGISIGAEEEGGKKWLEIAAAASPIIFGSKPVKL